MLSGAVPALFAAVSLLCVLPSAGGAADRETIGTPRAARALPRQVATVFGTDDRREMTTAERRVLRAIGLVRCERDDAPLVTAAIVNVSHINGNRTFDVIATVAHAFYDPWGRRYSNECYFYPQGIFVKANRVRISHFQVGTRNYNDDSKDWAVAVVPQRLSARYGSLGYTVLDLKAKAKKTDVKYVFAGLNYRTARIDVSEKCRAVPKKPAHYLFSDVATFNHNCDLEVGASGGPLMVLNGDRYYIVAVQAAQVNGAYDLGLDGRILVKKHKSDPSSGFDAAFNPNIAVRVDGEFKRTIDAMARSGGIAAKRTPVRTIRVNAQ